MTGLFLRRRTRATRPCDDPTTTCQGCNQALRLQEQHVTLRRCLSRLERRGWRGWWETVLDDEVLTFWHPSCADEQRVGA